MIHIDDIGDGRISLYTDYNEPQLFHYNEPDPGIFIAETPMVIERALDHGAVPVSFFIEAGSDRKEEVQRVLERAGDVPVYEAELQVINKITGFNLTRGVLAAFKRSHLPGVADILERSRHIAVLEDIVNPTNVGAIFRSAAALGVDAILMTTSSTDPFYRRAARVSMGTVFDIPWTYIPSDVAWTDILHDSGYKIISMALKSNAVPISELKFGENDRLAIVFGSEGDGIREETIANSDHVAIIPMKRGVDSLNVAAASAVTFWELL